MPLQAAPLTGTFLHAVGAACAALCYAPQRKLHRWSWQNYWLAQAAAGWVLLPWLFAWLTVPQLGAVLREAPVDAMVKSVLFGAIYGVGGIAFGVAIRYVGYSLTYAVAIGISSVLGTLLPPLMAGRLGAALGNQAGTFVVEGVILGTVAMLVTGWAGYRKERELAGASGPAFDARVGLPLCLLAGVLSAVFNFSLLAAQPIADVAARHGAGEFQGNVMYLFSHGGTFLTTLVYAGWLLTRRRTWGEFRRTPDGAGLLRNYGLAFATGLMWYLQFFFYGLGHVRMGTFQFSSWAIHMIILILLSSAFGVLVGEWRGCRRSTRLLVAGATAVLVAAVCLISYGNHLAAQP